MLPSTGKPASFLEFGSAHGVSWLRLHRVTNTLRLISLPAVGYVLSEIAVHLEGVVAIGYGHAVIARKLLACRADRLPAGQRPDPIARAMSTIITTPDNFTYVVIYGGYVRAREKGGGEATWLTTHCS